MDARLRRGRRADARVQPDPAATCPRFNIRYRDDKSYPVPGADRGGDLAARAGHAGREAQERPVLRSVRPRVGHPRHARRADQGLPGPDLHELVLRLARPGPAPVPVLRHRPVLRPVRALGHRGHRGVLPGRRRRAGRLPERQHEARRRAAGRRDAGGGRAPGVRAGRQAARPARRRAPRHGDPGDGAHPARGPRRDRPGGGRPGGRVPGVLRARGTGARPPRLGGGSGRGPEPRGAGGVVRPSALYGADRGAAAGPGAGAPGGPRGPGGVALRAPRAPRSRSASRSEAPSAS